MKITDAITINAPVERVFSVFTDLEKATSRVKGINSIEVLEGSAQMQVGTKWRESRTMMGKEATEVMWVSELAPNASYIVDAESHGMKYQSKYSFQQNGAATEVKMTFEGTPVSTSAKMMNVLGALFAGASKKALHRDLEDLKIASENPQ